MKKNQKLEFDTITLPKVGATKTLLKWVENGILSRQAFTYIETTYQKYITTLKFILATDGSHNFSIAIPYLLHGINLVLQNRIQGSNLSKDAKTYTLNICNAGRKRILNSK